MGKSENDEMWLLLAAVVVAIAFPNASKPDVPCASSGVCVKREGEKCTVTSGFVAASTLKGPHRVCAAPMKCLRDWATEDEGRCVRESRNMPCLMNNLLGDCSTLLLGPNSYCREGVCRQPPSFPGDHCYSDDDCTAGGKCVSEVCRGLQQGQICTNQFRLCDRGLFCPNKVPGHATCQPQAKLGDACEAEFSAASFLHGFVGVNQCVPGSYCREGVCVANDSELAKPGENCTERILFGQNVERLCDVNHYCSRKTATCLPWPETLWSPCSDETDCAEGMVCNCKVGGIQVCEVDGEEGPALHDFVTSATREVSDCIAKHECWRGLSAYPKKIFNEHSCAWLNCRKEMSQVMHNKYCVKNSLPQHRDCVMDGWCDTLIEWQTVKATPPPSVRFTQRLSPLEISAIVVGSLLLTLLAFFSGYIVGWLRQKYRTWVMAGGEDGVGGGGSVEFAKLDSLISNKPDL